MKNKKNMANSLLINRKENRNKSQSQVQLGRYPTTRILSLGIVDLELTLNITEIETKLFQIDYKSVSCLEGIEALLDRHRELLDLIILSSNNSLITSLLYINKITNKKSFIEFMTFNKLVFSENEIFMKDVIKYVTEHNFFFISENEIVECGCQIFLTIKYPNRNKIKFRICKEINIIDDDKLDDDSFFNPQSSASLRSKFDTDFTEFNYFMLDLNDNFVLQEYLQNNEKQSTIIDLDNMSKFLKEIYIRYTNLKCITIFPSIISNASLLNIENIQLLVQIFAFTDFIIFDKKEAFAFYKIILELNDVEESFEKNKQVRKGVEFNTISNEYIEKFFIKEIKFKLKEKYQTKQAMFIDEFNKILILDKNTENKFIVNNEYRFEVCPKRTHLNLKLIKDFKQHMAINYSPLRAIFIGGFLSKLINSNSKSYFSSFKYGQEITKRVLELYRTKTDLFLNSEFYIVNLNNPELEEKDKVGTHSVKENQFVLDCLNPFKSKLRTYDSSKDKNLKSFFGGYSVTKHMRATGMIYLNSTKKGKNQHSHVSSQVTQNTKLNPSANRSLYDLTSVNILPHIHSSFIANK